MFNPKLRKALETDHELNVLAWRILTALRGPDVVCNSSEIWKEKYTAYIRAWAVGNNPNIRMLAGGVRHIHGAILAPYAPFNRDTNERMIWEVDRLNGGDKAHHYVEHLHSALRAIDQIERYIVLPGEEKQGVGVAS